MLKMIILASTCTSSFLWRFSWALLLLPVVQRLIFWQWICTTFFVFRNSLTSMTRTKTVWLTLQNLSSMSQIMSENCGCTLRKLTPMMMVSNQLLRRIDNHEILMTSVILPAVRYSGISYTAQWSTITIEIFQFK